MYIFSFGLKPNIRSYVALQNPQNLADSFKWAIRYEAVQSLDQFTKTEDTMDPPTVAQDLDLESRMSREHKDVVALKPDTPLSTHTMGTVNLGQRPMSRYSNPHVSAHNADPYHNFRNRKRKYRGKHRNKCHSPPTTVGKLQASCNVVKLRLSLIHI